MTEIPPELSSMPPESLSELVIQDKMAPETLSGADTQEKIPPQTVDDAVTQDKPWRTWFVCDGRLRSGWRVALYAILARLIQIIAALVFGLAVGAILVVAWSGAGWTLDQVLNYLNEELSSVVTFSPFAFGFRLWNTIIVLGVVFAFRRFLDKRSFRALGFQLSHGWWQQVLAGFAFTLVAWGVIFVLALIFGAATIKGFAWERADGLAVVAALVNGLLFNLFISIAQETDARGYVLQNLGEGIRFAPAVIVSSLYFGALFLLRPGAGWLSITGLFCAGVLFALGYYVTGRLWFSIGMHAAWSFAEGPLFGFPVGGIDMGGLFRLNITGPEWLIGGAFGPEAGVLAVAVEIAMIVALWMWTRRVRLAPTEPGVSHLGEGDSESQPTATESEASHLDEGDSESQSTVTESEASHLDEGDSESQPTATESEASDVDEGDSESQPTATESEASDVDEDNPE